MTALTETAIFTSDAILKAILDNKDTLLVKFSFDNFYIIKANHYFRTLYQLNKTDALLNIDIFQQEPELYQLQPSPNTEQVLIQLSIIDTGIGIPEDKKQIIFERFSRLTSSQGKTYEGSGIGLSIVKAFVKAMAGDITVHSEANKGSCFTVTLPFQTSTNMTHRENKLHPSTEQNKQNTIGPNIKQDIDSSKTDKTKILLVEDNPIAQKIATLLLQTLNCHVDLANCGETAIAAFAAGKYDLVFLDIGLPDTKGYHVSKQLREIEAGTSFRVPILGLSAHVSMDEQKLSIESGMDKILSKPLTMNNTKIILDHYVFSKTA